MFNKSASLNLRSFVAAIVCTLLLAGGCYWTRHAINVERNSTLQEAELQKLSYDLSNSSDFLTMEVRKFAVTLDPSHFRSYWDEVNVVRTREHVLKRLRELKTPPGEFDLLYKAKNNSDELVNTETRAMRLILEVYEVPEDQMELAVRGYRLTREDKALNFNGKVNKAREILYNAAYDSAKEKISTPIHSYQSLMTSRILEEKKLARKRTNQALIFLCISVLLTVVWLFYIATSILFKITVPLKNILYRLDPKTDKNVPFNESKSKPIALLSDLQELVFPEDSENK